MSESELSRMRPLRGQNFYEADPGFHELLDACLSNESRIPIHDTLVTFADKVSDRWDALAESAALDYDGPRIEAHDKVGNPLEQVWLPPPVRTLRCEVVEAGIFENRSQVEQFAKVYLLAHLGETSVTCPLACTEGLIRAIRAVGSDFLKENYLPRLLSKETPLAGAQFVTEQDMGSDVGALKTRAVADGDGQWKLYGEKWFCSAIDEYFLIAARPEGTSEGTSGVATFFVPRTLDGRINGIHIKRLKNKIGTRELPTAEINLDGAIAYNIGAVESGFKTLMNYVLNTSRLMNAASALGLIARAFLEAKNYTEQRSAFGQKIARFPMVQESLDLIEQRLTERRALFFTLLKRIDQYPVTDFHTDEAYWQRFLINLCKYRTAIAATECTREAILLMGGNGTIESFSILPRLYRDSIVIETWEGTHNTLSLQIARDAQRFPFQSILDDFISEQTARLTENGQKEKTEQIGVAWQEIALEIGKLEDPAWAAREARHLVDRLGALLETATSNAPMQ